MVERWVIRIKHHSLTLIMILLIGCILSAPRVMYAQNTDYEVLFSTQNNSIFKRYSVVYVRSIDFTELYNLSPPQTSSLDVSKLHEISEVFAQSLKSPIAENEHIDAWETSFISALSIWTNLKLTSPKQLRARLRRSVNVRRLVKLAAEFVVKSQNAYKIVDLEHSQALLDSAIELLVQARYVLLNPLDIGRLYLQRGVVAVEQKQLLRAALNFRQALLIAPSLRLKKGFDSTQSVRIFYQTLHELQSLMPQELVKLAEQREWIQDRQATLVLIKVKDQFFTSLWQVPKNRSRITKNITNRVQDLVLREQIRISDIDNLDHILEQLASRIWACLPIRTGEKLLRSSLKNWMFTSGVDGSTYLKSPVSLTVHRGFPMEVSTRITSEFWLTLGGMFSNSTQDESRDLTESFTTTAIYFGPMWSRLKRIWWVSLGLMIEGSRLGATTITRAVGCKFFDLSTYIPQEICDPQRDIRQIDSTWRVGPMIQLSTGFKVGQNLKFGLRLHGSRYFYQSTSHPFEWPIGVSILIGYSFNSK